MREPLIIKSWLYHKTEEPRLFVADEAIPEGWFESPDDVDDKSKMIKPRKAVVVKKVKEEVVEAVVEEKPESSPIDSMGMKELRTYIKDNKLEIKTFGKKLAEIRTEIKEAIK